jgi:uncharacterized membrane protein YoaK (UPF0700 family)
MRDHLKALSALKKWLCLVFASGCVNSGGWIAAAKFTTHVTGFATLFGIHLSRSHWAEAVAISSIPAYFLAGAMISALLVDRRIQRDQPPLYGLPILLSAGLLAIAALGGDSGWFGMFGKDSAVSEEYVLLLVLALASGLQNATVTTATGAVMRATHMTGLTTDLGLGLVRYFYVSGPEKRIEVRATMVRVLTLVFFVGGSVAGAYFFLTLQYQGFLVPAAISFVVALATTRTPDDDL